jgi:hypothetical protein
VVTPTPTPITNPFKDVKDTDWFYAPVMWAVTNNVTGGTSATTFSPDASCTRGQVVTFLWAAAGRPAPVSTDNPFTDVSEKDWFYQPVLWAVENGITAGTSPTKFSPDASCTRAQVVTFLSKVYGKNTGHIPLPSIKPIPIPTPIPVPVPSMIPVPLPITPKPVIK